MKTVTELLRGIEMTISYNALGSNGRFGNQMFQFAALRGIAANCGYEFLVPPPTGYGDSDYALFDCFEMSSVSENNLGYLQTKNNVCAQQFHFNEDLFKNCPDNANLHDYFQTEKYFIGIEDSIRKDFTFKKEIVEKCNDILNGIEGKKIFMHLRRGDYVNQPENHPACPVEYYQKAYKLFDDDCTVLVFSDDPEWVQSQEFFQGDEFLISEFDSRFNHTAATNDGRQKSLIPFYDLYMMSQCDGGIIANSSFSWWGAWLIQNPTQPIVAPNPWFGVKYSHYNMNDLIPDRWVTLKY